MDKAREPGSRSEWLLTTINAVREVMTQRLEKHSLDAEAEREVQMALECEPAFDYGLHRAHWAYAGDD